MELNQVTTASALKSVPSWNFTPWRSVNVYSRPSSEISQDSARPGRSVVAPEFVEHQAVVDVRAGDVALLRVRGARIELVDIGADAEDDGAGVLAGEARPAERALR